MSDAAEQATTTHEPEEHKEDSTLERSMPGQVLYNGDEPQAPSRALSPHASDPSQMLTAAIDKGYDPQTLQQLMELYERWEAGEARKAFERAMADFRRDLPEVKKSRNVHFEGKNNSTTDYNHADLSEIQKAVSPKLAELGLSYRWRPSQEAQGQLTITCIVTHQDGHREEFSLSGPYDNSGNKNPLQAIGSAQTYLQRYTLLGALGLASAEDDDGAGAAERPSQPTGSSHRAQPRPDEATIDDEQLANINTKLQEITPEGRQTNTRQRMLMHYGVERLADLPARHYEDCIKRIEHIVRGNPQTKETT